MSRYYVCIPLFCVLLLSGCAKLPDNYGLYQEPPSSWAIEQNNDRLRAIGALIQAGKGNAAKQQADLISQSELTDQQKAQFNLLYAQILLSFGEAEQAASKLAGTETGQLSINDKIKFYQSQAFAYSLTGNLLESIKARIALDAFLTKPDERKKNQGVILETLGLLSETSAQKAPGLPEWMSLAKILASRNQNPANYNSALASWRTANPQHPANIYLATVANMPEDFGEIPKSIAILLPESGPFLDPAKAIKAGFLAAHSRHNGSGSKPALHFYDTETGKISELYQKAVKEGAKLVIGPLNKDSIQDLAKSTTLTVPVLALNHVPNLSRNNLYQFALSPMDDVAEITQKAALDGHKKAVLLVPDNEQGKRISSYFTEYWRALGGTILKKEAYDPKQIDFSTAIKSLVGLDESQPRLDNSQPPNPSASDDPHKKDDVDVLFLSAYGKEGKSINTQLLQAGNLPVYAMPTIYSGLPDSVSDTPLNGITFCDTPWLFNGAYTGELSMMSLKDILNQFPSSYIRLVAMGIDAYHLAGKLTALNTAPYSGATGNLSLASDNRIKRQLVCAKFAMGQPELIGFAHSPSEGDYSGAAKSGGVAPAPIQ
ncbi:penicillin-binding protein activator [Methyloglobulus sp.]|uniref:penicillin-binding protein activator n=1 Tax=Methyloglobulus sp. TaxID=2518622 RepID=UPI0032B76E22